MNKPKRKGGHPLKHSGFSLVNRETLLKEHPAIRRYLDDRRGQIIQDLGGESALSGAQWVVLDRAISLLSRTILIEYFYRADAALPAGILPFYLAMNNSIRLSMVALGLSKRAGEGVLNLTEYIASRDAEKDAEAAAASQRAKDPGPIEGEHEAAPGTTQGQGTGGVGRQDSKEAAIATLRSPGRDVPGENGPAAPDPGQSFKRN